MKKIYFLLLTILMTTVSFGQDLIITGVYDGPLPGGAPKGIELYVVADIADLSTYAIGSANNGGGTDGEEFTFPAEAAMAGSYIYVSTEATDFTSFFGFAPNYTDSSMGINGDDAIELFQAGAVIDVFGDINTDGSGQPWDYLDGWAYRVDGTGPDGSTFTLANWTFSGINIYDGQSTNAGSTPPMPIGTYSSTASTTPSISVTGSASGLDYFEGNGPSGEGSFTVSGLNLTADITVAAGSPAFELSLTSGGTFTTSVAVPQTAGTAISTIVYVRLAAGLPVSMYAEDITATSVGATDQTAAVSGTVSPADPQVTILGSIDALNYSAGNGPSNEDTFGLEGLFLTDNVTVTAPTNFEVSLSMGTGYASSITVPQVSGTIATTDIYVRLTAGLAVGPYTGDVTVSSSGITDELVPAAGNVFGSTTNALVLTAAYDGPLSGGTPKGVEIYVLENIADLSLFGIGSAGNGGGTDGQEFTFPAVAVTANTFIYVSSEATGFTNFFGFAPDYTTGAMGINGDDAIELFENGQVIDTFGTIDCDPNASGTTCPEWEHTDGWAYRNGNTGPDGGFVLANWSFSGPNALDGEATNGAAMSPVPIGTYGNTLSTEDFATANFSLYPNPTNTGIVNIKTTSNEAVSVLVFNILGKQVINQELTNETLNVSNLNSGVYLIKLSQNGASTTKKLVIE